MLRWSGIRSIRAPQYLGWFLVINVGRKRIRWVARPRSRADAGYWSALSYFAGALCFQVNTTSFLFFPDGAVSYQWGLQWLSATAGSSCFTLAGGADAPGPLRPGPPLSPATPCTTRRPSALVD